MLGSAAPANPDEAAGPSNPIVAKLSSAKSGNTGRKAGFTPEAFQLELYGLLNMPAGVSKMRLYSSVPNTAESWSVGFSALT